MSDPSVQQVELRLVERASDGEVDAFRELFEMYRDVAFRVAMRITNHEQDALDTVQDGFIKAFESLSNFKREASFKTWLLRIVSNQALDRLRAKKVRHAVSLDDEEGLVPAERLERPHSAGPAEELSRRELDDRVRHAIEMLPPGQRSVFALFLSGSLTYGEIAEVVDIPIGTVMSRIYHARRQLQEALGDLRPHDAKRSTE